MVKDTNKLVKSLIAILIGVALIPLVQEYVDSANVTGTAATLIQLIPFFYALAVFLLVIKDISI